MNKEEAEIEIVLCVRQVDAIRESDLSDVDKADRMSVVDKQIKKLKEITGPRHIIGVSRR